MADVHAGIPVRSKLRLFLSLDIVGSTEFKQAKGHEAGSAAAPWVTPFLHFYRTSIDYMSAQWERIGSEIGGLDANAGLGRFALGDCPAFWKGVGDEVLFSKVVVSPVDALAALHAFLAVMKEHRRQFEERDTRLNVKGAAWLAGFPINNAEVVLARGGSPASPGALDDLIAENYRRLALLESDPETSALYHADFIGPSIDLGFRLRELATPRRLILSADLVWLLCHAHRAGAASDRARCTFLDLPRLGYGERTALRGISGGEPYPLIWIEAEPGTSLDAAEDRLLGRMHLADDAGHIDNLRTLCDVFLNNDSPPRMRPYIAGCGDPEVGTMLTDHADRLGKLSTYVNGAADQLASLPDPDEQPDAGGIPESARNFADDVLKRP